MANQLQVIDLNSTALALPAHLQSMPDIVGRIAQGDSRNRISLKGREFHIFKGGIEEGVLETKHMDAIIVGAHKFIGRQYFDQAYEEGVALAPACYSRNGNTPEPDSNNIQSDKCESCPQNVKGSSLAGGEKSRACGFIRPIAVILSGDPDFTVFQLDLKSMSIWGDGLPTQGKFSFGEYAKKLAAHHVDAGKVITRFTFDPSNSVPVLLFQAIGYIDEEQVTRVIELVETGAVSSVIDNAMGNVAATPAVVAPVTTPAPAKAPAPRVAPVQAPAPAKVAPAAVKPPMARPAPPPVRTVPAIKVASVAMPPEDDTPDPPATIKYGQPRSPQAPLATTRPAMRPSVAAKPTAEVVQQDVDALIAELDG